MQAQTISKHILFVIDNPTLADINVFPNEPIQQRIEAHKEFLKLHVHKASLDAPYPDPVFAVFDNAAAVDYPPSH